MTTIDLPTLTAERAGELVAAVRLAVERSREAIVELWRGRAWIALEYPSWDALCDAEFGVRLQLPVDERRELVADLRSEGMSTRAIGSALGVDQKTVVNDSRSTEENSSVEPPLKITGVNGKTYQASRPEPPPGPEPEPAAESPELGIVDPDLEARADEVLQEANENLRRRLYKHDWVSTLANAYKLTAYEPETIANLASPDEIESLEMFTASIVTYTRSVKRHRANLRVVGGAR